jgi:glycosyltransferase involved in cell wall biosynthesis
VTLTAPTGSQSPQHSTRPRDVFIVCNNVEEMGGLMRFAHTLGRLLDERGHRVQLVGIVHAQEVFDYGDNLPYATHVVHERHPPNPWNPRGIAHLHVGRQLVRARRAVIQRWGARRLSALFRKAQPGAIVIVAQVFAMEWVRLADTRGMYVIGMSHESFAASRDSSRFGRVSRYFAEVDRLLLLTQPDADDWAMTGLSNVGVMPNPIGLHAERLAPLTTPTVVSLGRFSWEKGFDLLLDAWAIVAPRFPEWRLRLYGDGPDEAALHEQAQRLGIEASVDFMGRTTDVPGVLMDSSVYALSSRHEGMPVVLVEAMEFGVPCVAYDVSPGVRDTVSHEADGLLVAPGNIHRFADSLGRLMSDPDLRRDYGARAHESVQRFAPDRIVERWEREFALLER